MLSSFAARALIGVRALIGIRALVGVRLLIGMGATLVLLLPTPAEAQLVRRFAGGEVQVNAPFVRVNVGPGGSTSVRAPFTAVDSPGGVFIGRRRRLMAQRPYAAPLGNVAPRSRGSARVTPPQPTPVDVDALPSPTASQLAAMDDATLVETLREMMGRFNYRLSRLKTGESWQEYLILTREILGSPGAPPQAAQPIAIQKVLPRYASVQDDPRFEMISALPSFAAAHAALQEVDRRLAASQNRGARNGGSKHSGGQVDDSPINNFRIDGPEFASPSSGETTPTENSAKEAAEILPTPEPAELPNAQRGERSILKRK